MTRNYVKVYDSKLKSMFDFIEDGDKEEEETKVELVVEKSQDDSLESKLDRLKTMRDKGVLPELVYLEHVNDLLRDYGL
jgi:hypothetical protein